MWQWWWGMVHWTCTDWPTGRVPNQGGLEVCVFLVMQSVLQIGAVKPHCSFSPSSITVTRCWVTLLKRRINCLMIRIKFPKTCLCPFRFVYCHLKKKKKVNYFSFIIYYYGAGSSIWSDVIGNDEIFIHYIKIVLSFCISRQCKLLNMFYHNMIKHIQ